MWPTTWALQWPQACVHLSWTELSRKLGSLLNSEKAAGHQCCGRRGTARGGFILAQSRGGEAPFNTHSHSFNRCTEAQGFPRIAPRTGTDNSSQRHFMTRESWKSQSHEGYGHVTSGAEAGVGEAISWGLWWELFEPWLRHVPDLWSWASFREPRLPHQTLGQSLSLRNVMKMKQNQVGKSSNAVLGT